LSRSDYIETNKKNTWTLKTRKVVKERQSTLKKYIYILFLIFSICYFKNIFMFCFILLFLFLKMSLKHFHTRTPHTNVDPLDSPVQWRSSTGHWTQHLWSKILPSRSADHNSHESQRRPPLVTTRTARDFRCSRGRWLCTLHRSGRLREACILERKFFEGFATSDGGAFFELLDIWECFKFLPC